MCQIKGGAQRDTYALLYQLGQVSECVNPSIAYLADRLGYEERRIQRALNALQEHNLIEVNYEAGKRNVFHLNNPDKMSPPTKCHPRQNVTTPHSLLTPPTPYIIQIKEENKEKEIIKEKTKRFSKPTPQEVQAYCDERENGISGEAFCDFYESKGWVIGKSPMKDWKAAVRTWEKKHKQDKKNGNSTTITPATAPADSAKGKPYSRIQALGETSFHLT